MQNWSGCWLATHHVDIKRNCSAAATRIDLFLHSKRRSMINVCHILSFVKLSRVLGFSTIATVNTSNASLQTRTSSPSGILVAILSCMRCNSSWVALSSCRLPLLAAHAKRMIALTVVIFGSSQATAWTNIGRDLSPSLPVSRSCSARFWASFDATLRNMYSVFWFGILCRACLRTATGLRGELIVGTELVLLELGPRFARPFPSGVPHSVCCGGEGWGSSTTRAMTWPITVRSSLHIFKTVR